LANSYEETGNYKAANIYYKKHYTLKDSISGANVIDKIASYNAKITIAEKDIAIKTAKIELQKKNFAIILFSIVSLFLGLFYFIQTSKNKRKLKYNEQNLLELTSVLIEKNRHIAIISGYQIEDGNKDLELDESINPSNEYFRGVYNNKILTDKDWEIFKSRFEKVHPILIERIRKQYVNISESEERLFLFLKLNLKSKEIAEILGITTESVKRTRNRLRKRLALEQDVHLENFIRSF
jgi:DNA-binding CsgD family transcriptional regulator